MARKISINNQNVRSMIRKYLREPATLPPNLKYPETGVKIPIGDWDVSRVTDMANLFYEFSNFNEDINNWGPHLGNVTNMEAMFRNCRDFNHPLDQWGPYLGKVTNMRQMFMNTHSFNQPLNNWNVSKVKDMSKMFEGAVVFNSPLNNWNVTNVKDMSHMFEYARRFNQPLNEWGPKLSTPLLNTRGEEINRNMKDMFFNARSFNQNPEWELRPETITTNMFRNTGLDPNPDERLDNNFIWNLYNNNIRPQIQQTAPQGVAFEIHNAFDNFKLNKFMEIISSVIGTNSNFKNTTTPFQPLIDNINSNLSYSTQQKTDLTEKIANIFQQIQLYNNYNANIDNITNCIQYILMQPQEVIDTYINTFVTDCLKAYSTGARQSSCIKGMYERIFFSFRDTMSTICLDQMQGTGAAPLCKPEYIEIFECFYESWPREGPGGLNEMLQEWYGDGEAVTALLPEERNNSFIQFVKSKINNEERFKQAELSIRKYAEEQVKVMFGGKKRKTKRKYNKSNKKRQTKKNRRK